jgi:hypothetical protein
MKLSFLNRFGLMFLVVQPIVLLAFSAGEWLGGPPEQTVTDAFLTTFALGYLWGLPVFTGVLALHSLLIRDRGNVRSYVLISCATGSVLGALVGLVFALLGRSEAGSTLAFLMWPVASGALYGLLIPLIERKRRVPSTSN